MKVLAYTGEEKARSIWPEAELVQDNPPQPAEYDGIYLENFMQQLLRREVDPALQLFYNCMKPGGKLVIVVPSLEWACREIATKDFPSALAYPSLYGTDEDLHRSGFTLPWLRAACEKNGFTTEEAYCQDVKADINGDEHRGRMNVYVGIRPVEDASEAV